MKEDVYLGGWGDLTENGNVPDTLQGENILWNMVIREKIV